MANPRSKGSKKSRAQTTTTPRAVDNKYAKPIKITDSSIHYNFSDFVDSSGNVDYDKVRRYEEGASQIGRIARLSDGDKKYILWKGTVADPKTGAQYIPRSSGAKKIIQSIANEPKPKTKKSLSGKNALVQNKQGVVKPPPAKKKANGNTTDLADPTKTTQIAITPENAAVEIKKHLNAVISDSNSTSQERNRASSALARIGDTEKVKKTDVVSKRKADVQQKTEVLKSSQQPAKGATGSRGDVGRKLSIVDQAIVKNNMKGVIANRNKVGGGEPKPVVAEAPKQAVVAQPKLEKVYPNLKQNVRKVAGMFPEKSFQEKPKTYQEMVKKVEAQEYNRVLRERTGALKTGQKETLLRGGRRAQTIVKTITGAAKNAGKTHVDSVLYDEFDSKTKPSLGQTEMAVLGSRKRVDLSERVKSIRVLSKHKGAIGLTPNQRIRKTRIGKEVVDRVVGAKGYRQRHMPMEDYRKMQAGQTRSRIAREAANKRWHGAKTPTTPQQKETQAAKSRQFRLQQGADKRKLLNAEDVEIYKKMRDTLASKGNTKSAKQILQELGPTPTQAKRGKALVRRKNFNVPHTTGFKRKVRGQILQKGYVKMKHSGKSPTKPQSITDDMHKQVGGKLTGKTHSFQTGVSKSGKPIYKTTPEVASGNLKIARLDQAMSIPGRSFKTEGGAVLFNMGSQIRVDIQRVLANLKTGFPKKVNDAIKASAEVVGKKMLDIIEPYVPKDTYYMYQSAKSNADQSSLGQINITSGAVADDSYMYGVSFSYNTPYAELVYFGSQRHGKEYNDYHKTVEKGEKETARWVEVAFEKEQVALRGLLDVYAKNVHAALNSVSK